MPTGGCACGAIQYAFSSDPHSVLLCNCPACHLSTNSAFSTNLVLPYSSFSASGAAPTTWQRTGKSGQPVTNHFCGVCGTLMWVLPAVLPGTVLVKAGTLHERKPLLESELYRPGVELWAKDRWAWCPSVEGVKKFEEAMS
ncbi:uncharacterized protein K452DRAFT_225151 [Aplosporella prunicola CBS 121167]|uniref:CENP-V/GFA domain-containing protein n=1 Tax=Aplosporella prunicola CBS 121167 TaxID=1176127 RepID=A0A6A6BJ28_9PEZI|nr:uncharacterized protein K452DRAFT_225151 [Aplosporella prunicola CBS 121167]KAF2143413.1 hypothetical protein K452DRAFT_225151 [Aplosporella prunicola CBS 121167]